MRQGGQRRPLPPDIPRWRALMRHRSRFARLWWPRRWHVPSCRRTPHPLFRRWRRCSPLLLLLVTRLPADRPLKLCLLRATDDRRLALKHLPQEPQQLFHAASLPHPRPVAQIRVIHPPVHPHMLSGSNHHVLSRVDVHDGRFLWVRLRDPEFEGKAVGRTAKGDRQGAGEGEEKGGGAVLMRVDFGAGGEGGVGRDGAGGGGVGALGITVTLEETVRVQVLRKSE